MDQSTSKRVLEFWFGDIDENGAVAPETQARWWKKSDDFDALCRDQFEADLRAAASGELPPPKGNARHALAYIVLCDQLSRNMHRGTPGAFATDGLALAVSQELIRTDALGELSLVERSFALMPLMHSEERSVQEQSVSEFSKLKEEGRDNLSFALAHKEIIDRFGRYPHRNAILGRESTAEEAAFLTQPGSSF